MNLLSVVLVVLLCSINHPQPVESTVMIMDSSLELVVSEGGGSVSVCVVASLSVGETVEVGLITEIAYSQGWLDSLYTVLCVCRLLLIHSRI